MNNRVFRRTLLALLAPVFVVCGIAGVLYGVYTRQLDHDVISGYESRFSQSARSVDLLLTELDRSILLIGQHDELSAIFASSEPLPLRRYHAFHRASELLGRFQSTQDLIASTFVYFRPNSLVVGSGGTFEANFYFDVHHRFREYPPLFWYTSDGIAPNLRVLDPTIVDTTHPGERIVQSTAVIPLVYNRLGSFYSRNLFVVNLSVERLFGVASAPFADTGAQTVIVRHDGSTTAAAFPSGMLAASDVGRIRAAGGSAVLETVDQPAGKAVLFAQHLDNPLLYGFSVAAVVPFSAVRAESSVHRLAYLLAALVAALVLALLALILSVRLYRPVRRIVRDALSAEGPDSECGVGDEDEYQYLESWMYRSLARTQRYENELSVLTPLVFEHYLVRLLNGVGSDADELLRQFLTKHGMEFPYPSFGVAVWYAAHWRHEDEPRSLAACLRDAVGEMPPSATAFFVLPLEPHRCAMIVNQEADVGDESRLAVLRRLSRQLAARCSAHVAVGVGRSGIGVGCLKSSYTEALVAVSRSVVETRESVCVYREESGPPAYHYTIDDENRLYHAIVAGATDAATTQVRELLDRTRGAFPTPRSEHQILMQIYHTVLRVLYSRNQSPSSLMGRDLEDLYGSEPPLQVPGLARFVLELVERACRSSSELNRKYDFAEVLEYVDTHFREPIYLESVAERFGMSGKYLSKFFRRSSGVSFYSYLTRIRVDEARRLLRTTEESVDGIGRAAGFGSRNTFVRAFKRLEGMPPSQYRVRARAANPSGGPLTR